MEASPSIKIFISCHKASVCPDSQLYIPVHVGAESAETVFDGAIPDNQGDNISSLNGSFCELTAQYWAWRNTMSDYVGLCHYRRFFCFDGKDHNAQKNDHMQIEIRQLNPATIAEYSINDDALTTRIVTSCDAVVAEEWDVGTTMTPCGVQYTVREHMKGYGLIKDNAFELLECIVSELHPEYLEDYLAYVNGSTYIGYNCFVMTRDLFERLCAFEFDILMEFAKQYDDDDLTPTQRRIHGYLGEILFSTFVLHSKAEGKDIRHYPLTFFFETDPPLSLKSWKQMGTDGFKPRTLANLLLPTGTKRRSAVRRAYRAIKKNSSSNT